jgi:hypothetical protein
MKFGWKQKQKKFSSWSEISKKDRWYYFCKLYLISK